MANIGLGPFHAFIDEVNEAGASLEADRGQFLKKTNFQGHLLIIFHGNSTPESYKTVEFD